MNVCIFGASGTELAEAYYKAAFSLGRLLAENGHTVVFGGGKEGLMGAAARGVSSAAGRLCGIVPRFFDEPGVIYEGCTELVFTETMRERKQLMEDRSDACVVLPGGIGTYEELFEMLTLKQLGRTDRAIVLLNTEGYFEPLFELLRHTAKERFMSHRWLELFSVAETPEEALSQLDAYTPTKGSLRRLADYNKD